MTWALCFIAAVVLFTGPGLPLIAKRIARVYGVYFAFAFVLRGLLLVTTQPSPGSGSSFAIADLAAAGYTSGLDAVLPYAALSAFGLYAGLWLLMRFRPHLASVTLDLPLRSAAVVYVAGSVLRLGAEFAPANAALARLGALGQSACLIVLAGIVLGTDWRSAGQRLVVFFSCAEFVFSVLAASKTPILTVLLLVYLDPRRPRLSIRVVLLAAVAIVTAFTTIQRLKPTSTASQGGNLPEQVFFALAGRLDGLFALAGVWRQGPGLYEPDGGFAEAWIRALLPGWLQSGDKQLAGQLWGLHIYRVDNGTSYAEGLAGEGLAIGGTNGPLLWGLAGGLLLGIAVLAATSQRSRFLQFAALGFIASTAAFERGLLGQFEQVSAALQAALVITVGLTLAGLNGRARRPGSEMPTRRLSAGR